jgi:hypothetical protein
LKQYLIDINNIRDSDYSLTMVYKWFIVKERAIYTHLNMLKSGDKILIGLMWCPTKMKNQLETKLYEMRSERKISAP